MKNLHGGHGSELVVGDESVRGDDEGVGSITTSDRVGGKHVRRPDRELHAGRARGVDGEASCGLRDGAVTVAQDHGVQPVGTSVGVEGHVAGTRGDKHVDRAHVRKGVVGDVPLVGDDQGVDSVPAENRVGGEKIDGVDRDKRAGGVGGIGDNRPGGLAQRAVAVAEDHGRETVDTGIVADGDIAGSRGGEDLDARDVGEDIVADLSLVIERECVDSITAEDRVSGQEFDRIDGHRGAGSGGAGDREGSCRLENLTVSVAEDNVRESDIAGGVVAEGDGT